MSSKTNKSELEEHFVRLLQAHGITGFVREYRFDPRRRWRADFAHPELRILVEIEGGAYTGGHHVRPLGYIKDCEKYNRATILGYRLLRYANRDQMSQFAVDFRILKGMVKRGKLYTMVDMDTSRITTVER